jgi:hypothetical protein
MARPVRPERCVYRLIAASREGGTVTETAEPLVLRFTKSGP